MKKEIEIELFTDTVEENIVLELYNKSFNNLEKLNDKVDKYTLYLVIVIFTFFISSNLAIESFQIGPINIKDSSVLTKILPIIYFELIYIISIMSMQKSENYFAVKKLGKKIYKNDYEIPEMYEFQNNFIDRVSLPFSFSSFGNQMVIKNGGIGNAIFGILVALPTLLIILSVFVIGFYMIKNIYDFHLSDILGKISFFISIWMVLAIFYTIRVWTIKNKNEDFR